MRLGVFGGSFDPVHYGHLLLAECCREHCRLDAVWFVPAAVPPHKQHRTFAPTADRVAMLELALAGNPAFTVCQLEIERGGLSYSVDTLEQLHQEHPDWELFLLMGADMLADLPNWRNTVRVCQLALPVVVSRAGTAEPDFTGLSGIVPAERIEQMRCFQVQMPACGISATELRNRVQAGQSIRYQVPRAVEMYIETHGLYRTA